MTVDFFARLPHYIDHLAPMWSAMDESVRGNFYVPVVLMDHARLRGIPDYALVGHSGSANRPYEVKAPTRGGDYMVTCGYKDLMQAASANSKRKNIFMQHGIGLSFQNHDGYAGGGGFQSKVNLFLHPNGHTRDLVESRWPKKRGVVVGTPKMDAWAITPPLAPPQMSTFGEGKKRKPVVAIGFHWNGERVAPEAGNAFEHYKRVLPMLAQREEFTLIGHGHPRIMAALAKYYEGWGVEVVRDFDEVLKRADLFINDCSSTLYEFCVSGKPVVILNAPWFRKNVSHGIRFWEYSDVGPQVERPEDLLGAILDVLKDGGEKWKANREKAVEDLYPFHGQAAKRAAEAVEAFVEEMGPKPRIIEQIHDQTVGLVYMGFGEAAAKGIRSSVASLRRKGMRLPVCVVGDSPVSGMDFIEWEGQSPFDTSQAKNFQFRAGRVKPFLVDLTPFERTLYIDADTEFMGNILPGFECLDEFDIALAEELLSIGQLYNKPRAGWEINIIERDKTIEELGGDPKVKFLNSGVIFFKRNEAVKMLFHAWAKQWLRFQQWDEQLSLMRALHECPVKYKALSVDWNHPHRRLAKIIFHNYGRGTVRSNIF